MKNRRIVAAFLFAFVFLSSDTYGEPEGPQPEDSRRAQTENLRWRFITGGQIRSRPAVTPEGVVYVLSEDRHIYAIEEESGELLWRHRLDGRVWDSLTVGPDGIVYTVLKTGSIVAVNRSGFEVWRYQPIGQLTPAGDPVVTGSGSIVVGYECGTVLSVSHRGVREWRMSLPAAIVGTPIVDARGSIYFPCEGNTVFAVSVWGRVVWRSVLAGRPTTPAISAFGLIVVGTDYGSVVALDTEGNILWDFLHPSPFLPPVITEDSIFAVSADGGVHKLSFEGDVVWSVRPAPDAVGYSAVTDRDGIYFSDSTGTLHYVTKAGVYAASKRTLARSGSFIGTTTGAVFFGEKDWLVYAYDWLSVSDRAWPQAGRDTVHSGRQPGYAPFARIDELYGSNADYLVLRSLADADDDSLKLRALAEIRDRVTEGTLDESTPYVLFILTNLVSEGLTRTVVTQKRLTNDFPVVRREAAILLGEIGDFHTSEMIARLVRYEFHEEVKVAMVRALGRLRVDRSGSVTEAVARMILDDARSDRQRDLGMVWAGIETLGAIYSYYGWMPSSSGFQAVYAVYLGDYPKALRTRALEILRFGRLGQNGKPSG